MAFFHEMTWQILKYLGFQIIKFAKGLFNFDVVKFANFVFVYHTRNVVVTDLWQWWFEDLTVKDFRFAK